MKGKSNKIICSACLGVAFLIFIMSCSNIPWWKTSNIKDPQFLVKARVQSGNPDSHYLLACYYQERGRHKEAMEEFKKVLLIDPKYVRAYNGMGVSYDLTGDFARAIEHYIYAVRLDPDLGYVYNNLGYSYLLQGDPDDAIAALNKAISLNSKDQRFHNNLALAYGAKGQYDRGLAEFKLGGDEARAHHNIAQIYFTKGLMDKAKVHYAIALKINPSLTVVRTAIKAADALARIFELELPKAEPKQLAMPDPPVVAKAETKKIIAEVRTATPETNRLSSSLIESPGIATVDTTSQRLHQIAEPSSINPELRPAGAFRAQPQPSIGAPIPSQELRRAAASSSVNAESSPVARNDTPSSSLRGSKTTEAISHPPQTSLRGSNTTEAISQPAQMSLRESKTTEAISQLNEEVTALRSQRQPKRNENLISLKEVGIEISNGNGVNRMARKVGDYFKEKGLKVTRVTNANNFNHAGTRILYLKEYDEAANHVAGQLPVLKSKEEMEKFDRPNVKIKILIGKDLVPHQKSFENGKKS